MKLNSILILLLFFGFSCNRSSNSHSGSEDESSQEDSEYGYSDGTYCADVEYYNPNTGTRNSYDLDVEVEDGELVKIYWTNGGWLDESHFSSEVITDGECSFTSDKGYRYTVTLGDKGGCGYSDSYKVRRDMEDEKEATTCPKCFGYKEDYEDLCYSCQSDKEDEERKEEEEAEEERKLKCPECGGRKDYASDDMCEDCKDKKENEESN